MTTGFMSSLCDQHQVEKEKWWRNQTKTKAVPNWFTAITKKKKKILCKLYPIRHRRLLPLLHRIHIWWRSRIGCLARVHLTRGHNNNPAQPKITSLPYRQTMDKKLNNQRLEETMGSFDGSKVCELVGSWYFLNYTI